MNHIYYYTESNHFDTIAAWARTAGVEVFTKDMLPLTTYIATYEGAPAVMLSLITTNTDRAYLEYALGNPDMKGPIRRQLFKDLVQYVQDVAQGLGYSKLICLAPNTKLSEYYASLGYSPNLSNLSLMVKELN